MKLLAFVKRLVPPIWFGIVVAIAAESWLKFQAPGITRELGLGIGKIVFTALNRTEIVLALLLAAAIFAGRAAKVQRITFIAIALILAAQTAWLLPQLIGRIDAVTSGQTPPKSSLHLVYVGMEVVKLLLLLTLSIFVNRGDADRA